MKKRKQHAHKIYAVLLSFLIVFAAVMISGILVLAHSDKPVREVRKQSIEIAQSYADLQSVDDFYWFTWKDTYYSVTGTDTTGAKVIVVIPKSGGNVRVFSQEDGYDEKGIRTIVKEDYGNPDIRKVTLGFYDDQVVWEVITQGKKDHLNYYLLSFETGEELKAVDNL